MFICLVLIAGAVRAVFPTPADRLDSTSSNSSLCHCLQLLAPSLQICSQIAAREDPYRSVPFCTSYGTASQTDNSAMTVMMIS